jgi:chemotaxis protein MotB
MKPICIVLVTAAVVMATGCSKKELIAQKDAQIAELRADSTRLASELDEQRRVTDDLNTQLADLQEQKRVWLEEKDGLTFITLDGSATFATAQADLTTEGKEVIDRVWTVLQNYPDRRVLVEGHADNRPIRPSFRYKYASNWELSSARAHSVLHYLEGKYSLEPGRLAAVGYGENDPVADNETAEGRAQNRRVVITVGSKASVQQRKTEAQVSAAGAPDLERIND